MSQYKTCKDCGQSKPFDDFYKKAKSQQLRPKCKKCTNLENNLRRQKNPDSYRKQNLDYYYKNKDVLNKYRRAKWPEVYKKTIEYQKEKHKKYRLQNPEKVREFARRRRARKLNNGFEKYTENQIIELWGTNCHICKLPIDMTAGRRAGMDNWEVGFQVDHVIPLFRGGSDTLDNVKPAHGLCNIKKHAR